MGFSQIEFSPYMYIKSSLCGPNRDLNWTLNNKLLLLLLKLVYKEYKLFLYKIKIYKGKKKKV